MLGSRRSALSISVLLAASFASACSGAVPASDEIGDAVTASPIVGITAISQAWRVDRPLDGALHGIAWSPDGERVVASGEGSFYGQARTFTAATGAAALPVELRWAASSAAFSADGRTVHFAGERSYAVDASGGLGEPSDPPPCNSPNTRAVERSPNGDDLLFRGDNGVCVSGVNPGGVVPEGRLVHAAAYGPHRTIVMANTAFDALGTPYITMVRAADFSQRYDVGFSSVGSGADSVLNDVAGLSSSQGFFAGEPGIVVAVGGRIFGWVASGDSHVIERIATGSSIRSLSVHPTLPLVATAHEDGTCRVYNLRKATHHQPPLEASIPLQPGARGKAARWSPDGRTLACASEGALALFRVAF